MNKETEKLPAMVPDTPPPEMTPFANESSFELGQRMAKALSNSALIPTAFQGKIADCMIALEVAHRLKVSPLSVLQNIYLVHGKPSFSAKFMISAFNASPDFGPLRYQWKGDEGSMDRGCRAMALDKHTGELVHGPWITMGLAKSEGWIDKKGSKWKTMPEKMLLYRAAAWFIDTYAPELMIAAPSLDGEMIDVEPIVVQDPKNALKETLAECNKRMAKGEPLGEVVTQEELDARKEPEHY